MKIEADSGYIVKIGEPVCVADIKATRTSVAVPSDPIADGDYLISLEVNGTVVAHRDTFSFASGSATVGDYTVAYASNTVTVSTTSNNDIVRLMIEPLKVRATDEFRAAVGKAVPQSGGGSGGGAEPLILHITETPISGGTKYELDKTAGEIYTAFMSGSQIFLLVGSNNNEDSLRPVWRLEVKNGYVSILGIYPSVLGNNFTAYNATVKPFYTTSSGGND